MLSRLWFVFGIRPIAAKCPCFKKLGKDFFYRCTSPPADAPAPAAAPLVAPLRQNPVVLPTYFGAPPLVTPLGGGPSQICYKLPREPRRFEC